LFEYRSAGRVYNTGKQLLFIEGLCLDIGGRAFNKAVPFTLRLLSKFSLFARIFRLSYDAVFELNNDETVVFLNKKLFIINSSNEVKTIALKHKILGAYSDGESVYFGDYFGNSNRERVSVHMYSEGKISILWTFLPGEVRHIHNVIPYKEFLLILTGDYGDECAVFMYNFSSQYMCVVTIGDQLCRYVTGVVENDYLITATDSHIAQNYTVTVNLKTGTRRLGQMLPGPVFDIVKDGKSFYLTTVVEKSNFNLSDYVEFHRSSNGIDWIFVSKWKKDIYPKTFHKFTQFNRVFLASLNGNVYLSFLGITNKDNKIFKLCK